MNVVSFSQNKPAESPSSREVSGLCRRIELLRYTGENEEANRLETEELRPLLSTASSESDPSGLGEEEICAIRRAERERVENADVLAELLAPLLAKRLKVLLAPKIADPLASSALLGRPEKNLPARSPASAPHGPKSIADLIDGMLGQDRATAANHVP